MKSDTPFLTRIVAIIIFAGEIIILKITNLLKYIKSNIGLLLIFLFANLLLLILIFYIVNNLVKDDENK